MIKKIGIIVLVTLTFLTLNSCSSSQGENWNPSEMAVNIYNEEEAIGDGNISLDVSSINEGYVGVKVKNAEGILFQLICNDEKYNYKIDESDIPIFIPLQCENGLYRFRFLKNTVDDKYVQIFETNKEVELIDEFKPFIRPSVMVAYDEDSYCVEEAKKLQKKSSDEIDFIKKVYKFIQKKIDYDKDFAKSKPVMYYPDPDKTLKTGKGICFDYATLAASMLRSQGIPTKVITGYVSPNELYHAWNMIYVEGEGWITVKIEVSSEDWNRIDITFADTGSQMDATYTDRLVY
ncbi:MAG: transglutaminase domain-containing protein [Clostridiales bacterium]|nr:transglutaminase domain-containing protein [Clostridiales bacterium]